jgi:hypothetical protein
MIGVVDKDALEEAHGQKAKYCPRCCRYLLRIKNMPFQFGMPGLRSLPDPLSNRSASFAAFGSLSAAFSASANLAWPVSETALAL